MERNVRRRRILMSVLLTCFIIIAYIPVALAAEKGPIKIGFIAPTTGNFAQMGLEMIEGAKMVLERNNYTVAGRKIEFISEDESMAPDTAANKARKLIKHDSVHLVTGVFMTSSAYAVGAICKEFETPLLITVAGGDDLTQRKSSKWVNRVTLTSSEMGFVPGDYAYKYLGWRKALSIAMDYGMGHEAVGGFQTVFEQLGGKVIQKIWVPMTTMDFGPFVASMNREADGIMDSVSGAMSVRLMKTMRESGILNKLGVIGISGIADEITLPALGEDALGTFNAAMYAPVLDSPKNNEFRELCKKTLNKLPTFCLGSSWVGIDWVLRAIKSIDGDVENKEKLTKALREVKMEDSIRGPLRIDSYGQVIQTYYVRRVDKVQGGWGGYQNTVVKTYPEVSQFWTWDPKTYMSNPVYSRDYPPCQFCK
jgi:branched-chain amino acid transport system substrate-binding protein